MPKRKREREQGDDGKMHRTWAFTWYAWDKSFVEHLINVEQTTGLVMKEEKCPSTGRHHLQGFVAFKHAKTFMAARAVFDNKAHIEPAKGTGLQNHEYCTKPETTVEGGFYHCSGKFSEKRESAKPTMQDHIDLCKEGKYLEIDAATRVRCGPRIKLEATLEKIGAVVSRERLENYWLWSHTGGTGKGTFVSTYFSDAFVYSHERGWDGYMGQPYVFYDEADRTLSAQSLKIWCDYKPFTVRVMYGSLTIRPKVMIFASNQSLEEIFPSNHAVARRMTVIHFSEVQKTLEEAQAYVASEDVRSRLLTQSL